MNGKIFFWENDEKTKTFSSNCHKIKSPFLVSLLTPPPECAGLRAPGEQPGRNSPAALPRKTKEESYKKKKPKVKALLVQLKPVQSLCCTAVVVKRGKGGRGC